MHRNGKLTDNLTAEDSVHTYELHQRQERRKRRKEALQQPQEPTVDPEQILREYVVSPPQCLRAVPLSAITDPVQVFVHQVMIAPLDDINLPQHTMTNKDDVDDAIPPSKDSVPDPRTHNCMKADHRQALKADHRPAHAKAPCAGQHTSLPMLPSMVPSIL